MSQCSLDEGESLPVLLMPPASQRPFAVRRRAAIAASIVLCLVGAGVLALVALRKTETIPALTTPTLVSEAVAIHEAWLHGEIVQSEVSDSNDSNMAVVRDLAVYLASVGLSQTIVSINKDRQRLYVGYTGSRGCRVSLLILPREELAGSLPQPSDVNVAMWTAEPRLFILVATAMPTDRFGVLARFLEAFTRDAGSSADSARVALLQAWEATRSCAA